MSVMMRLLVRHVRTQTSKSSLQVNPLDLNFADARTSDAPGTSFRMNQTNPLAPTGHLKNDNARHQSVPGVPKRVIGFEPTTFTLAT